MKSRNINKVDNIFYKIVLAVVLYNLIVIFFTKKDTGYIQTREVACGIYIPYLTLILLVFGWIIFIVGLFQLRAYLNGKDNLLVAKLLFGLVPGYMLFLSLPYIFSNITAFLNLLDYNAIVLFLTSTVALFISSNKNFKKIHTDSIIEKNNQLRQNLGL